MNFDRQMKRGKEQSLYKYLPDSWIDFPIRGRERRQYIAKVDRWHSEKLEGINVRRLIRAADRAVKSYAAQAEETGGPPPVAGFGGGLTPDNCDVLTPVASETEPGISARISPLTFYCKKCYKVYQFRGEDGYRRLRRCVDCGEELAQFRQIYFCKCGFATDRHPVSCRDHGSEAIYWDGRYNFSCRKCGKKVPMGVRCQECGAQLGPKAALDPAQFYACHLSLIDLVDERLERFLFETDYGKFIAIASWLGKVDQEQLNRVIDNGVTADPERYKREYERNYREYLRDFQDEEEAARCAKVTTDISCGNAYASLIADLSRELITTEDNTIQQAEVILEYGRVRDLGDQVTLDRAVETARLLNTGAAPEKTFPEAAKRFGIADVRACEKIPFVSCSYGYTRVKSEYEEGVRLRALKEERPGRKNIYATRMYTEGVLFELDRRKILEWLLKNGFILPEDAPDLSSEEQIRLWFVSRIKPEKIRPFNGLEEWESPETYYVYRLLHSVSHLLIRAAADIGGLGKDSLSEYIFPGIPAVLVYVQNSQGFNLGSLLNTFEAYFDRWLFRAAELARKCVFDPICIERHGACTGCLYLNEVSCQHFNRDLDRSLVIGHVNKRTRRRIIGFWEEGK